MECKCAHDRHRVVRRGCELIDTLWNVNSIIIVPLAIMLSELIDTLWNVNLRQVMRSVQAYFRINRYIMECKSGRYGDISPKADRINRYIMECKFIFAPFALLTIRELIDTLWNVNSFDTVSATGTTLN